MTGHKTTPDHDSGRLRRAVRQTRASVAITARRLSAQTRPHLVLASVATAGTIGAGVGTAVPAPTTAGLAVTATGAAATGLVCLTRRRRHRVARPLTGGIAAAGWVGWVTAAGLSWPAAAALAAGGVGASLRHWRRHRIPDPPAWAPPELDDMSPPRLWARHVGNTGGALPDSALSGEVRISTGLRYDLHLVPGRQTLTSARQAVPKLRSGLRLTRHQDLMVEHHPTADESVLRLTIVQSSPVLSRPTAWPGPTYQPATGRIQLGPYVDGVGTAEWRLHQDHRLYGGFLCGSTGSGKSRQIEGIALSAAAGGFVVWFGDPQGGASSTFLADHADWTALDVDGIRAMLDTAMRVRTLRQIDNTMHKREGFTPAAYPGLVIIIDECHEALREPDIQETAATLARSGGKVGIALILASQVPTMDAFGGGKTGGAHRALRGSVVTGNLAVLRTAERGTDGILPGLSGVEPETFPAIAGYAYLVDNDGSRRSAPYRGYYLTDDARDQAAAQITWPELDPDSAQAAGVDYQQRHTQADHNLAQLESRRAALLGGAARPVLTATPSSPATAWLSTVPQFPVWTPPAELETASTTAATTAVDAVAAALAGGATRPAELETTTGYGETSVRNALAELRHAGRVRRAGYGRYELTATPAAAGATTE